MLKLIIVNTNKNRDGYYYAADGWPEDNDGVATFDNTLPFWLSGDYVSNSSGDSTNDITRAHLYNDVKAAERQCDKLNKKFAIKGRYFGELGFKYPDSVNDDEYGRIAPTYEVKKVEVSVKLLTS